MNPFGSLTPDNDEQIRKYLRFFRQKKDGMSRTINKEFTDMKNERLYEDMYTKEDVMEYTDFLASSIRVSFMFLIVCW